jgi:hypothetical protein
MINRNWDQGSAAIRLIKKDFGDETALEWIACDLGNLENVREVFSTIREKEERLDLVCFTWSSSASFLPVLFHERRLTKTDVKLNSNRILIACPRGWNQCQ